ncbi:hypothetical protein NAT51_14130 [Flavobacterium amniphilum]|uniref:hypothetical protein n=1 Tax=Flavobacterium amniphilum TaxID=1834035 RepID=UPI002029E071|nr:hypothetical protein [Flavobacterium amniphilum]MCL9806670.1 hypothetical protein [Flavobacterium amniphilum]
MKTKLFIPLFVLFFTMNSCSVEESLNESTENEQTIVKNNSNNSSNSKTAPLNLVTLNYNQNLSCNNANLSYSESYYQSQLTNVGGNVFISENHSYSMLLNWNINVDIANFNTMFYLELKDLSTGNIQMEPLPANGQVLISHLTYQWPTTIDPYQIVNYKEFEYRFVYKYRNSGQLCTSATNWKYFNLIQ